MSGNLGGCWSLEFEPNLWEKSEIHTDKKSWINAAMSNTEAVHLAMGQVHILNFTTFKPFIESVSMVLLSVILPITKRCQRFFPVFQQVRI